MRKPFETRDVWETRIPYNADLWEIPQALDVVWREDASSGRYSVVWYAGDAPQGENVLLGEVQLTGAAYIGVYGGVS